MLAFRKWVLVVATLAIVAMCAEARPDDKDKETKKEKKAKHQAKLIAEEGAVRMMLLHHHKAIRDDLKLTEEQAKKLKEYTAKQWKKAQSVHELEKDKQEAAWKEMRAQNKKFLEDTLTKEQLKRLEQIAMQVAGLLWVTRSDIAKELKLTKEQRKKLHELQKKAHEEMHALVHAEKEAGREEKIRAMVKLNKKRLLDVLTDDQKAEWKKLAGEMFKGDLSKD